GAIVVTLQKPTETFGGDAEVSYGSYDRFMGRASVNLPVNDQVMTRTSVFGITDDGYVHNLTNGETLNDTHNWGVREALRVKPAKFSNVEWNVAVDYSDNDSANVLNFIDGDGANGSDRYTYTGFSKKGGALEPYLTGAKGRLGQGVEVKSGGVTSNLQVDFAAGTLNVITGWRSLRQSTAVDFPDAAFGPAVPYDQGPIGQFALAQSLASFQTSQEVKWNGKVGDRLNYTVGGFYMYETNRNNFGAVANVGGLFGLPYFPFSLGDEFTRNNTISEAVYAQGDWRATDKLTLTVGGRYTHEIKTLLARPNTGTLPGGGPLAPGFTTEDIQAVGYQTRLTADEFTPRFAVQYQFTPRIMAFASATRGFQGGGWNGLAFSAETFNNFNPETVWSYETGFRSETPDRKLRVNATFFYEDVKDYQLLSDLTTAASFVTTNAADFEAYGAEFDVDWRPIEKLTLSAQLGAEQALYYNPSATVRAQQAACAAAPGAANASCGAGIVNLAGELAHPSNTPPLTFSASARYDWVFPGFTLTPNIAVQWVARQNVGTEGVPAGIDPSRAALDLGLTFQPQGRPWSVTAECRNCTMDDWGVTYLFGYKYFNQPGVWDVAFRYRF
ncbi:MAG: TonB-dependent receptor, partial [Mycobacteriaceae bacterium]|nr:TonB-dependent receptor [Mycobacteriaceae bacterium]